MSGVGFFFKVPSYLLPLVLGRGLQLVGGHQLLQHPGNHGQLTVVVP